ncbi:hypothetical protein CPC08DRAFT_763266 [Agrocybe pediades]|nr:hypothetical protein CPC08DRAFT_763266 [Agrocybe pediades]
MSVFIDSAGCNFNSNDLSRRLYVTRADANSAQITPGAACRPPVGKLALNSTDILRNMPLPSRDHVLTAQINAVSERLHFA